ncbi:MAG TPA: sodium/glutamate symporter [Longimicrobiales bacterium]|nr:sodium/glutamate symporter [Longimicrobiales bacterium]
MFKFDFIHTLAFTGAVLFIGYGVRNFIRPLARYNIPAPVVGGLLVALASWITRSPDGALFTFDTALQTPLMIAFFTSIGFGASLSLLRVGGPQVLLLFLIASVFAIVQNLVGIVVAVPFGLDPLFGVLAGAVTLTGGPATGLAFAPEFEAAGVTGAATIAVATAMGGIVFGGLVGGPLGTRLIERYELRARRPRTRLDTPSATEAVEERVPDAVEPRETHPPEGEDEGSYVLLKAVVAILIAMWIGSVVSRWFVDLGITLPAYIGAMLVAAVIRNLDDVTGIVKLPERTIEDVGNAALSLFLVMALMTLKLWELAGLALPLIAILIAQIVVVAVFSFWWLFRWMGRDYDAAVMSGGFIGFMLGTTANAMANMRSLVERYGPAPRAFLVIPMVGAFFIDFTNAIIITIFLNVLR